MRLAKQCNVKAILVTVSTQEEIKTRLHTLCQNLEISLLVLKIALEDVVPVSPLEPPGPVLSVDTRSRTILEADSQKAFLKAGSG